MDAIDANTAEEDTTNPQMLNIELQVLKEEIHKRDLKLKELEGSFNYEREKSDKFADLLRLEKTRNEEGERTIFSLKEKLDETNDLIRDLKIRLGSSIAAEDESSGDKFEKLRSRISEGEDAIKELQGEMGLWKNRCEGLESKLSNERDALGQERLQHEQLRFQLAQKEELLSNFGVDTSLDNDDDEDDVQKLRKIISGMKASIDVQSGRNIELHQELQSSRKDLEESQNLLKSLQEKSEKEQNLINELNSQNEHEYQKNEKHRGDIQRLKRDVDSWKKIQSDMKAQYQDLRTMYDGVCKHADEQKREMLELKLLMDREKRSIARQRDEIDKLKGRVSSFKQTYDDLKAKFDENNKLFEVKKVESRTLASQLQVSKKTVVELQTSNKDLKKRGDFSQKELIEKHKILLQAEEKLKEFENNLNEKETEVGEYKKTAKDATEKAEKHSQDATNKEKDLHDRIALIQNLQTQVQELDEDLKAKIEDKANLKRILEEKETIIDEEKKDAEEQEEMISRHEQKVLQLENKVREQAILQEVTNDALRRTEVELNEKDASISSFIKQLIDRDTEIQEEKSKVQELEEEMKVKKEDLEKSNQSADEEKMGLRQEMENFTAVKEAKNKQIQQLSKELEEQRKRVHLQDQLLKDLELKFDYEDLRMIQYEEKLQKKSDELDELKVALNEKDRLMDELKRELEESAVIQVYLKEIEDLNEEISEEKSLNDQLKQKLAQSHLNVSEETSRVEEEKKEMMLQMTKELKREKLTSQSMINDLREDVRVLEYNVENEKDRSLALDREVELKDRQMKNERESLLQHIEELQQLYSDEKRDRKLEKDKVEALEKQLKSSERERVSTVEEYETKHLQILAEKRTNLVLDRQEKIEDLKKEVEHKKKRLFEVDRRLVEANKSRQAEQVEVKLLVDEKDDLIASLRRENSELRKGWEKESQWMEENVMEERPVESRVSTHNQMSTTIDLKDEESLLVSQNLAIQKIKQKIHTDYNLDKILLQTEHTDDNALDALHEASTRKKAAYTKTEKILTAFEKVAIVLFMSPLAYVFLCEFFLTFCAVLIPAIYFIHQKPWKNLNAEHEKMLSNALNALSLRFAAECAENVSLRQIVENLNKQCKGAQETRGSPINNNEGGFKVGDTAEDFENERKKLVEALERQSREENEKQKEELMRVQQKQENDRRRLHRQQSLIDKLEVILQEKEIKSRLGQFWGYEELKMAIHRLKHEREVEKNKYDESNDENIQKRVFEVTDEAVGRERRRKFEALIMSLFISAALILGFSVKSSSVYTVASSVVIAACSVVFGIRSWREVEHVKDKLQSEQNLTEAQSAEIKELSTLMDREYDVVSKQKQAIEALERRLNDEYKKNKDHQLTIARLSWVFQESEDMRSVLQRIKDVPSGVDINPELRKLAEDHARDKFAVFRSMQEQLEEHNSSTEEQRKAIDDLKNATNIIVNAAERRMSEMRKKELKLYKDKNFFRRIFNWKSLLVVLTVVSSVALFLKGEKTFVIALPILFAFVFVIFKVVNGRNSNQKLTNFLETTSPKISKPSLQLSFSSSKQYGYDFVYVLALAGISYYFKVLSLTVAGVLFGLVVFVRLATYLIERRKVTKEITSWNNVLDDLRSQIHGRAQLIDVQTEEIQTLKKLLEVERSYSQHAERLLKDAKGGSDEGFEELTEEERLKKRADEEDARLVNYELDEMKIFLDEEKKTNVQLRKTLAKVKEGKLVLNSEVTNLKRKLEMEQIRRKEIIVSKEEESLLQDRIEELIEDLEAEQRTKQELSAQLIEERSSRELKQIELGDIKERIREEQHIAKTLREQVLRLVNNDEEQSALRNELAATQNELEEERVTTQRHSLVLIEAIHRLREHNIVLQRQIEELRNSMKDDDEIRKLRDQSEVEQDEIERLQILLEEITSTKKALKYQDLLQELQTLRQQLGANDPPSSSNLLDELELQKEKNKILEEAVEELQRQQQDQRKMFEEERKRSIELARQLSNEDIPMLVEEDSKEELEDKRGVLYWLGTNGGLTEWKNPAESGLILISRSSYGHGRATDVANRKPSWCSTSNKPNQWWKVDFGDKRLVVPTAYSLRHGWSGKAGAIRNWVFECSADGRKWVVLRHHHDDDTINTPYGFGHWKLDRDDSEAGYRFVRVRQTGLNSNGRHALRLCGIEVYGKLLIQ